MQRSESFARKLRSRKPSDTVDTVRNLGQGLLGGLVSTVVMTAFRIPIARSLPPTAAFWARYVGDGEASEYPVEGLVLHLLYGMGGGGLFALLFGRRTTGSDIRDERRGVLWGTVYGFVLSVFGVRVVLKRLLGMELQSDERLVFHVSHLIYGLTLGTWLGSRVE